MFFLQQCTRRHRVCNDGYRRAIISIQSNLGQGRTFIRTCKDRTTCSNYRTQRHVKWIKLLMSHQMLQWTGSRSRQSVSQAEKERITRSKRRSYLTWRNKTQSWLSKMVNAFDKLLRAEPSFTQQEFLNQLHLFHNKLALQGKIIETTKQVSFNHQFCVKCKLSKTFKFCLNRQVWFIWRLLTHRKRKGMRFWNA